MRNFLHNRLRLFFLLPLFCFFSSGNVSAQWVSCNGPGGGTVTDLDTLGGYLWVGTNNRGVFRSADGGQNWQFFGGDSSNHFSGPVSSMLSANGKLFIGTPSGIKYLDVAGGSASWATVATPSSNPIRFLEMHGQHLFSGANGLLMRSSDNGQSWQSINASLPVSGNWYPSGLVSADNALLLHTSESQGGKFFRSTDNGNSWTMVSNPAGTGTHVYGFLKVIGNHVYAQRYGGSIYSSADAGLTWQIVPSATTSGQVQDMVISDGYYMASFGNAIRKLLVNSGGTPLNWGAPLGTNDVIKRRMFKFYGSLFVLTDGEGILRSDTTGAVFEHTNTGLDALKVNFVAGKDDILLAHGDQQKAPWVSSGGGQSWSSSIVEPGFQRNQITGSAVIGNRWYISKWGNGVLLSEDNGQSWRMVNTGMPLGTYFTVSVYSLIAATDSNLLAGADNKLMKTDTDTSWTLLHTFPQGEKIHHLAEAGSYLFAGTRKTDGKGELYRSADGGQTWQVVSTNWQTVYRAVYGLTVQGNRLIVNTFSGEPGAEVLASTDFGDTWHDLTNGITAPVANWISFSDLKTVGSKVYAAHVLEHTLFELEMDSTAWNCINCQPGDPKVISIYGTDSTLYAGTTNNGVWKRVLPPDTTGSVSAPSLLPKSSGFQLYPNPAASPVLVADTEQKFPLELQIFDNNGRLVRAEIITRNYYAIRSESLSNGFYFLKLINNDGKVSGLKWMKAE